MGVIAYVVRWPVDEKTVEVAELPPGYPRQSGDFPGLDKCLSFKKYTTTDVYTCHRQWPLTYLGHTCI